MEHRRRGQRCRAAKNLAQPQVPNLQPSRQRLATPLQRIVSYILMLTKCNILGIYCFPHETCYISQVNQKRKCGPMKRKPMQSVAAFVGHSLLQLLNRESSRGLRMLRAITWLSSREEHHCKCDSTPATQVRRETRDACKVTKQIPGHPGRLRVATLNCQFARIMLVKRLSRVPRAYSSTKKKKILSHCVHVQIFNNESHYQV